MKDAWKIIPKKIDPEKEEQLKNEPLEKGDMPSMLAAAFFTIFLPTAAILCAFGGLVYLLFSAF